jgi:hypothetical protein
MAVSGRTPTWHAWISSDNQAGIGEQSMAESSDRDPSELLREATAKKKGGDMEGATKLLREAYVAISKVSTIYSIDTFLRLPLYLQEAGRSDEAWREFNRLLTEGYPNQIESASLGSDPAFSVHSS